MRKVLCVFVVLVSAVPALVGAASIESQAIVNASSSLVQPLRLKIEALTEQIKELLAQSNPDPAAIGNLMIQIKDLRGQIKMDVRDEVIKFMVLSPD